MEINGSIIVLGYNISKGSAAAMTIKEILYRWETDIRAISALLEDGKYNPDTAIGAAEATSELYIQMMKENKPG